MENTESHRIIEDFMLSANDIFYASALIFLGLIFLVWLAQPIRSTVGSAAASAAH